MKMKMVALQSANGADYGQVEIPDEMVGPETICRGGLIFIRKTHDVYVIATCCVVSDEP